MSVSHLPDDLSRWPEDPFEILGIDRDTEKRDAHRAYVRLIKKFKPDHSPAEFQRIHEAFELVKNSIFLRDQFGDWDDDEDEYESDEELDVEPEDADEFDAADDSEPEWHDPLAELDIADITDIDELEDPLENPLLSDLSDELFGDPASDEMVDFFSETLSQFGFDLPSEELLPSLLNDRSREIWQDAIAGEYQSAYDQLRDLADESFPAACGRSPEVEQDVGPELWMRLYWLVRAVPEVDSNTEPVAWLVRGLEETGMSPQILALYTREMRTNPQLAVRHECTRLLEGEGALQAKSELLATRWEAATRLGHVQMIAEDVERAGRQRELEEDECWARILLTAVDHLAWARDVPKRRMFEILNELEGMVHLHQMLDDELHRTDVLVQVAEETRELCEAQDANHRQLANLIRDSWIFPIGDLLPEVESIFAEQVLDPVSLLNKLDEIVTGSPHAMSQLAEFVERAQFMLADDYDEEDRDEEQIRTLVRAFFRRYQDYHRSRRAILLFCISESIEPMTLVQAADEAMLFSESWTDQFECDMSLRIVYAAYRAFQ